MFERSHCQEHGWGTLFKNLDMPGSALFVTFEEFYAKLYYIIHKLFPPRCFSTYGMVTPPHTEVVLT